MSSLTASEQAKKLLGEHLGLGKDEAYEHLRRDAFAKKLYDCSLQAIVSLIESSDDGWQDISTAPRDGTVILLAWYQNYWDEENKETSEWVMVSGQWGAFSIFGHDATYWCDNGATQCALSKLPTHWRPMPLPPVTTP